MAKGSGTRSGLLWEVERLLKECNELGNLPDVLVMENVTEVHGYKNKEHFDDWISFLESLGYTNYGSDLNAADYGVAQHRERYFLVSLLGDYNYKFPTSIPLDTVMADYLEDEVADKYYIKSQKAYDLIVKLVDNGSIPSDNASASKQASKQSESALISPSMTLKSGTYATAYQQEQTEEYQTDGQKVAAYLNRTKVDQVDVKIAKTLMARDWKGFGTGHETQNGVIERNDISRLHIERGQEET